MKILVFSTLFPNNTAPAHGVFIKNRMKAVSEMDGHEVRVVAPVPYFPPIKRFKAWYRFSQVAARERVDGLTVYHPRYLVTPKVGMTAYGVCLFLGALKTVKALEKSFSFDVIDAHYMYPDAFAAVLLGKALNKPVTVSARGSDIHQFSNLAMIRPLLRYTLTQADAVISVCASLKEMMVELGIPSYKVSVIPNGIDGTAFYPADRAEARQRLGIPLDARVILSVGSLIRLKGHHLLVEAFGRIVAEEPDHTCLYIVGDGVERGALHRQVEALGLGSRVVLCGQVPHGTLVDYYNAADLFFLGSEREGWPNVISESLACGTPVVATRVNGIPEIVRSDDLGVLVARDVPSFVAGIRRALDTRWDRSAIGAYGQSRSWAMVAQNVVSVLKRVSMR
ncbi:glycosyltransferase family 4 protein [Desulfoluna spongiiphila]|uniref:Glycosyltransferase involved in cell wall bisynthesis n=1 Tax=Desulfoluna spongiiphila TaxID=419481 RepID=A0A1G5BZE7_9BACT|nr:glycosyltransferase family 4 protein [Desulfoluna spongiiphila]SCX95456.1 Glycosyltransferase involved in cell wall bisynthesis [Desulfoluna spongiiphila]